MLLRIPLIGARPSPRYNRGLAASLDGNRRPRVRRRATTRASKETHSSLGDLDGHPGVLDLDLRSPSSSPSPPLLALKEWAPVIDGLAAGRVTLLLRKGGVREPRFAPEARTFALVPTSRHTDAGALREGSYGAPSLAFDQRDPRGIEIRVAARVTGAWTVSGDGNISSAVEALARFHPYRFSSSSSSSSSSPSSSSSSPPSSSASTARSSSTLARLGFRPGTPLTLLELRAFSLSAAVRVPAEVAESYWGCRSWVELAGTEAERIKESSPFSPALDDGEFLARARALREALSRIQGVKALELPL